jgi:hypothetical protein
MAKERRNSYGTSVEIRFKESSAGRFDVTVQILRDGTTLSFLRLPALGCLEIIKGLTVHIPERSPYS